MSYKGYKNVIYFKESLNMSLKNAENLDNDDRMELEYIDEILGKEGFWEALLIASHVFGCGIIVLVSSSIQNLLEVCRRENIKPVELNLYKDYLMEALIEEMRINRLGSIKNNLALYVPLILMGKGNKVFHYLDELKIK